MRKLEITMNTGDVLSLDLFEEVDFTYADSQYMNFFGVRTIKESVYSADEMRIFATNINDILRQDSSNCLTKVQLYKNDNVIFFLDDMNLQDVEYRVNSQERSNLSQNFIISEEIQFHIRRWVG